MNLILGAREYLFLGLSVVVLLMFGAKEYQINALENELLARDIEIEKHKTTIAHIEGGIRECNATISRQNEAVSAQSVEIADRERKLNELKSHPPDVRYKVIYKDVPKIELKSNECDDIKEILDSIKAGGL